MTDRTHPVILDHLDGVLGALENAAPPLPFQYGEWERPKDGDEKFIDPPYAAVRIYPSAAEFWGPLSDSQIDITLRVQILGVGLTHRQALAVTDRCRREMKKSKITVENRRVMDVRFMVVSGGEMRDDDLPTPFHYSSDLYELLTTPE
jgi:hypothetical protein